MSLIHEVSPRPEKAGPGGASASTFSPSPAPPDGDSGEPPSEDSAEALDALAAQRGLTLWHPWRWVASMVALVLVAQFAHALFSNPIFQWEAFRYWFFRPIIIEGLLLTLKLTAISAVLGFFGGVVLALMRLSKSPLLKSISWGYIWIVRSIPLIVLLLFLANISALYQHLGIGIPFGPQFHQWNTIDLLGYEAAAILGLSLNESAYAAEIVRAGIISVDQGQTEAANALGLPRSRQFSRIILPQAARTILPSYANQLIGLLKGTSVVYITSLLELFGQVETQASTNQGQIIPLLVVGTVWYIVLTSVLSVFQYYVERYFSRGALRTLPSTPAQRILDIARTRRGLGR
ncbi:MAG: amino acid ABC transporter permease [Isosphaeraceae bacterium]